ncbi:transposable element Tcb1 transposase [Trichonephila clavipes]|nr:transposable element Tcb1 transposase [Trichonephila clavipes]
MPLTEGLDGGSRNSSRQEALLRLSLSVALSTIQVIQELIAIICALDHPLNSYKDSIWILTDSRSSIQYLNNWPKIMCSTGLDILSKLVRLGQKKQVCLHWIPSHVGVPGNEAADKLAAQSSRRPPHHKKCTFTANCFIRATIQAQIASSLGVSVSFQTIERHLAEGHLGSWRPLRVLPLTPIHQSLRLEWCHARGSWTTVNWNQVVFSDETRFSLNSDDNRVRVWKPRGQHLNPAFALQQHTAPTAGVLVWSVIAYDTRSPLVLIRGLMTA